jgi:hypothetical protein
MTSVAGKTPSSVSDFDGTVHIVCDDLGMAGRVYCETDERIANREAVINDLLAGQFSNPVRVVAFNTSKGWALDVSKDVARDLVRCIAKDGTPPPPASRSFIELHIGEEEISQVLY